MGDRHIDSMADISSRLNGLRLWILCYFSGIMMAVWFLMQLDRQIFIKKINNHIIINVILTFNGFTRCQADLPQPEVISIYGYSYILTAPKMQKYLRICVHNLPMLAMPSSGLIHRDSMHVCNINVFYTKGPLNAWIWLAEEHSEVCNYFQGNARWT